MVSILVPAYNAAEYLGQCLDSIVKQTYQDLQIVVIDDGSKDATWQVMQDYAKMDSRIEVYRQNNQGVATTRNSLLDHVKGEWVLFVDSDDWLEASAVSFFMGLVTSSIDVISCDYVLDNDCVNGGVAVKRLDQTSLIEAFLRHTEIRGQLWNKLFRASVLQELNFDPKVSYGEDALFCWHAFQRVKGFLYTNKRLYHYRKNYYSISNSGFGPNKMSAHFVWEFISSSTEDKWPSFVDIARARWGVEDVLLLRSAAHYNYPYDNLIGTLQKAIRANLPFMKKKDFITYKTILYSFLATRSYYLAGLF